MQESWAHDKEIESLYSVHVGEGAHMLFIESQALISCITHATLGLFKADQ